MAKEKAAKLRGPLYTEGGGLGKEKVEGPKGGKEYPDPLGFNKTK